MAHVSGTRLNAKNACRAAARSIGTNDSQRADSTSCQAIACEESQSSAFGSPIATRHLLFTIYPETQHNSGNIMLIRR
jgi:hypothetical protein